MSEKQFWILFRIILAFIIFMLIVGGYIAYRALEEYTTIF